MEFHKGALHAELIIVSHVPLIIFARLVTLAFKVLPMEIASFADPLALHALTMEPVKLANLLFIMRAQTRMEIASRLQ